ncbi:type II CAAX endopeptidase family protein [uncultured Limosilactobacillus sp.]|uniref:CPBP family intramembrane glutamic endopeptidase n=1 Tax=uncultured Limosilactobacillus sp. TaxID=2837629 RepID=UPI0025F7C7E5|nr:type II CAAX endopeptidase family protein [uncultured Limosilactobacillus sp.]
MDNKRQMIHQRPSTSLFKRVLIMVGLGLIIQIPPTILLALHDHRQFDKVTWSVLSVYLVAFALIILVALKVYRTYDRHLHRPQGLGSRLKWVVGGYVAILIGEGVLSRLNYLLYHQTSTANNNNIAQLMGNNPVTVITMGLTAVILTPIAEELIFRGALMNLFFKDGSVLWQVILSGVVFGSEHASTNPVSFLIYVYLGMVLAVVYVKSGDIKNSMLLHALNNLIAMMMLLNSLHG